jgi:hypothetical protein
MRSVDHITCFDFYVTLNNGSIYVGDIQGNIKTFVLSNNLIFSYLINEYSSRVNKHVTN